MDPPPPNGLGLGVVAVRNRQLRCGGGRRGQSGEGGSPPAPRRNAPLKEILQQLSRSQIRRVFDAMLFAFNDPLRHIDLILFPRFRISFRPIPTAAECVVTTGFSANRLATLAPPRFFRGKEGLHNPASRPPDGSKVSPPIPWGQHTATGETRDGLRAVVHHAAGAPAEGEGDGGTDPSSGRRVGAVRPRR